MKIQGDEFLKNVQMKQEEDNLKQRINQYEEERQEEPLQSSYQHDFQDNNSSLNNLNLKLTLEENDEFEELLMKNAEDEKKANRKKYLILGIALILLFVITISIVGLMSGDDSDLQQEQEALRQEQALNENKIQQDYQQIVNDKLKQEQEEQAANEPEVPQEPVKEEEPIAQPETTISEPVVEEPKPTVAEQTPPVEPAKPVVVEKPKPKPVEKKPAVKPIVNNNDHVAPAGEYIQVGAFSKVPADSWLSNITAKGFSFKLHNVNVNGKKMVKVIVGPYKTRSEALDNLHKVKRLLNAPNAYALKIQ